jgi:sugar phosphate isomerase/epimerase
VVGRGKMEVYNKKQIFSLFTKAWKGISIEELCIIVDTLGFDGIEFPLRPGYQVEPQDAAKGLPYLSKKLESYGLKIFSVAAAYDENIFSACADTGIPIIRTMIYIDPSIGYMEGEYRARKELEKSAVLCSKYNIKLAVQNHFGHFISNSMELHHLVESFDPKQIGIIWDAAHSGLAGEEPEFGLDICWPHLCMINLKSAYYKRINNQESDEIEWERYFTVGKRGLSSWARTAKYLRNRNYNGVVCLSAEYSDERNVNKYILEDIVYARSLFE